MSKKSHCSQILAYLNRHGSITPAEAEDHFGCRRLAARISDLRESGLEIKTVMEQGKNRFGNPVRWARYYLIGEDESC